MGGWGCGGPRSGGAGALTIVSFVLIIVTIVKIAIVTVVIRIAIIMIIIQCDEHRSAHRRSNRYGSRFAHSTSSVPPVSSLFSCP